MNYELAKKLKEAGFPQIRETTHYLGLGNGYEVLMFPSLSELIEACGKERLAPNRNTDKQIPCLHLFRLGWGDGWFAGYEFYESRIEDKNGLPIDGWGDTPEEAVANLWLELNKK